MITLHQLCELGENVGIDIFEGLTLPENSPLNRDTLVNSILEHCGMNIPIYADPKIFYNAVALWSARNQYTFIHVGKIYEADYSPIENKYYIEEIETDHDRKLSDNTTGTKSETSEANRTVSNSGSDTTTDENVTSAYDENTYQEKDKNISTTEYGRITDDSENSEKNSESKTDKAVDENENTKQKTFGHGNVGVTSNNALQIEDYSMIEKYNPYTFLCGLFENDLTLFIY